MVNAYGLQTVAQLALGQNPGMLQQVGTGLLAKGVLLAHSRSEELEADEYGARYTSAVGYDPHGIATFFGKLLSSEGKQPGFAKFLSSHPPTQDRIAHIKRYIQLNNLKGSDLGADRIAPIKARLKGTAAPRGN